MKHVTRVEQCFWCRLEFLGVIYPKQSLVETPYPQYLSLVLRALVLPLGLAVANLRWPGCPREFVQKAGKSLIVKLITPASRLRHENCICFLICRTRELSPVLSKLSLRVALERPEEGEWGDETSKQ